MKQRCASPRSANRRPKRPCLRTALIVVLLSLLEGQSSSSSNSQQYSNGQSRHQPRHPNEEQSHVSWNTNNNHVEELHPSQQPQQETPRQGATSNAEDSWDESPTSFLSGPPPPHDLPLRFLRAGKNDPDEGWKRYQATLLWRRDHGVDNILREAFSEFELIKRHYPTSFHGKGHNGEPTFYERPGKTNVHALKQAGVDAQRFLRFYTFLTEFQWQMLSTDDHAQSIYIVDLEGIGFRDFVGETREFILTAAQMSTEHYPERGGKVFLLNAPRWFHAVFKVIEKIVDESTLDKIVILPRGQRPEDIRDRLVPYIPLENIPQEFGGASPVPLGQADEEQLLLDLVAHNNRLAEERRAVCQGCSSGEHANSDQWSCRFCKWTPVRSY